MKKILKNLCLVVIVSGIIFTPFGNYKAKAFVQFIPGAISAIAGGTSVVQGNTGQAATAASEQNKNSAAVDVTLGCIKTVVGVPFGLNLEACTAAGVYLIMWLFSWILWLSGKILDISIYYTINMADLLTHVPVVDIGWKIFRDLANIFFIFILLWIAIGTILGLNSGKTKELLVNLVVVALLMNFSLFITKAVIDASNIVALHFYDLIISPNPGGNPPVSSLAGAFMEGLAIQTLYEPQTVGGQALSSAGSLANQAAQNAGGIINMGKIILIGILGIILMMTAAYVFFVAAILFIIRVVVLMMIMILSPLAFLGFILPATEHYAEQWKEQLIHQSLFAPIYLALCYVVIKAIQSPAFKSGVMSVNAQDTTAATGQTVISAAALVFGNGAGQGSTAGLSFIFNFILLIGLMLASIIVAKKMEAVGVEFAEEAGKSARGFVGRNIMRGTYISAGGSATNIALGGAGRVASAFGFKDFGKKLKEKGEQSKQLADKIQRTVDINEVDKKFKRSKFGATELGSFIREKTTGGKLFGVKATFGGEESVHEAYEESEKLRSRRFAVMHMEHSKENLERLKKANEELPEAKKSKDPAKIEEAEKAVKKAESLLAVSLSQVSPEDFANMGEHTIAEMAKYATLKQLKAVIASEDWSEDEKREMVGARWKDEVEDYKKYQEQVDKYDAEQVLIREAVLSGNLDIDGKTGKIDEKQITTDANGVKYATTKDGRKLIAQDEKPKLPGHLKAWARNKMTLQEYEMAALARPDMFDIKELVHTMRWGLTNKEIRTNENFSFALRDRLTYDKDSSLNVVVPESKDPNYIKSDAERDADKAEAAFRSTHPTPTTKEIEDVRRDAMENSVTRKAAFEAGKKAAEDAEISLKTSNPSATKVEISEARNRAFKEAYAEVAKADTIRRNIALNWKSGRAANELAGARSRNRNAKIVHSLIDEGIVQHFKEKDSEDITFLLENILSDYKAEEAGAGIVSDENRRLIKYLFTDPRSKTIPRPIEDMPQDLKDLYQRLEKEGESTHAVRFKSDEWRQAK